jgi:hypothetical protein
MFVYNCTYLYLIKKWEYNDVMHQLFMDLQKDYDLVTWRSCIIFSMGLVSPCNAVWIIKNVSK